MDHVGRIPKPSCESLHWQEFRFDFSANSIRLIPSQDEAAVAIATSPDLQIGPGLGLQKQCISNRVEGKPGYNNIMVCNFDCLIRSAKFAPRFPSQFETAGGKAELDNGPNRVSVESFEMEQL